jgi:2-hydroxy-3-oxopropionate reductase
MKVAFLGTGLMGASMARKIAAARHHLTVWNRELAKVQALADVPMVAETPLTTIQAPIWLYDVGAPVSGGVVGADCQAGQSIN